MSILARQQNWALGRNATGLVSSLGRQIGMARNRFFGTRGLARGAMRIASSARQRVGRSYTMGKRRKSRTNGVGITTQHDSRLIYKRRPMSRRKRRAWKKFISKVKAVSEKDLGTQQVVHSTTITSTSTTSGNQLWFDLGLYSLKSSRPDLNDLNTIAAYISAADQTVAKGLSVGESSKIIFKSGVFDVTFRNASTNNGAADAAARLEVDVYECTCSHSAEETGSTYNALTALFDLNSTNTLAIGGGATSEILTSLRGSTPFDFSYTLSRFGIRILKKTKYTINNGDQVTYQLRDPTRRVATLKEISNQDGYNKPGWTRSIIVVAKLAPGLTQGPIGTPGTYQPSLVCGLTRKYTFKVENWSEDRTAYAVT